MVSKKGRNEREKKARKKNIEKEESVEKRKKELDK